MFMWEKMHGYLLGHHHTSNDKKFDGIHNYSLISLIRNNDRKLNLTGFRGRS